MKSEFLSGRSACIMISTDGTHQPGIFKHLSRCAGAEAGDSSTLEHQPHHDNYTHELIVRSCELLQQPSDVMIAEKPSAPPHPSPPLQLIGQPAALRDHLPRQKPVTHFKCYFSLLLKINFRDLCKFICFSDAYRYVFGHFCLIL